MAEDMAAWSPYNYVFNNPLGLTDPTGMAPEGDFYRTDGTYLGSDGKDDNKVYSVSEGVNIDFAFVAVDVKEQTGKDISNGLVRNLTEETGITHEQFQQFGANVYNEAPYETSEERDKVASAIVNRKETSTQGGTWERTLDKIMFNKDSHDKKMTNDRANPKKGAKVKGTNVLMTNVGTENYQDYYKSTPIQRNSNKRMKDATRASIEGLTGLDKVNGANSWRGRGQGKGNRFFKEKK